MNKPDVWLAIETIIKYLLYLNVFFVIYSIYIGNSLSIIFCSINLVMLLLRQGIKSKTDLIEKGRS